MSSPQNYLPKLFIFLLCLSLTTHSLCQMIINPPDLEEQMEKFLKENSDYSQVESTTIDGTEDPETPKEPSGPEILSVGIHFIDGEYTLNYYKKHLKTFILAEASFECQECTAAEDMLDKVFKLFMMGNLEYKQKELPIVRREVQGLRTPRTSLMVKGKSYKYEKVMHLELFVHWLNRHLFPVVQLQTREEVDRFRDTEKEWIENTPLYNGRYRELGEVFKDMEKVTRVIAFVAHKDEHKDELKEISKAAKELGYRDDLRIAKVTNKELVMELKEEMSTEWFEDGSSNTMVVFSNSKKPGSHLNTYDLSSETTHLSYWINSASIEHVEKMSIFSVQIMQSMHMPMFIAFIDTSSESKSLLEILKKVSYEYPQYLFGYFDEETVTKYGTHLRKEEIGITSSHLPQLALFNPPEKITLAFPEQKALTLDNIKIYLDNGLSKALKGEPIFTEKTERDLTEDL